MYRYYLKLVIHKRCLRIFKNIIIKNIIHKWRKYIMTQYIVSLVLNGDEYNVNVKKENKEDALQYAKDKLKFDKIIGVAEKLEIGRAHV